MAPNDFAFYRIGPAKLMLRFRDIAVGQMPPDRCAGYVMVVAVDLPDRFDCKSMLASEICKKFGITGLTVSETEIFANNNVTNLQVTDEDPLHKLNGSEL